MKKLVKIFLFLLIIFAAVSIVTGCIILSFGLRSKPEKSDCIIVLGCRLYGNIPSPFLKARLDEGYRLFNEGYAKHIIVSGGKGNGETVTEAEAMKEYLKSKGVDSSRIITEDKSMSTLENLSYSKQKMDQKGFKSAVIVSNRYHMKRASLVVKKLGIKGSYSGVYLPQYKNKEIEGFIREIAALLYYVIAK